MRGLFEHSLAVEDPLKLQGGVLQYKPFSGVIGHLSFVSCDFLWRDFSVQRCLSLGLSHSAGDNCGPVWTQVYNLKMFDRWDEEMILICLAKKMNIVNQFAFFTVEKNRLCNV